MIMERLPEVQSLDSHDKWLLLEELWSDLARQVESAPPQPGVVALLEERFAEYVTDPSNASSPDEAFARLAERKRQWK